VGVRIPTLVICSGLALAGPAAAQAPAGLPLNPLDRASFNALAAELDLPLFWRKDANQNGAVDPDEVAYLWGVRPTSSAEQWTDGRTFLKAFTAAYLQMLEVRQNGYPRQQDPAEQRRRELVRQELAQGRPTLLESDFRRGSAEDQAIVAHVLRAAVIIEGLFASQNGVAGLDGRIPADDPASRMLFYRNQGPFCEQPGTEQDRDCGALPGGVKKLSGLYPVALQQDPGFCAGLEKSKERASLLDPFAVVREAGQGKLRAVPYSVAYHSNMARVSRELTAAADAIHSKEEGALKTYLLAAARAFRDNRWQPADEAWARMNSTNSRWYLRIGPDETYFEPCAEKAGFHVSFARINQDSLAWQQKLDPLKTEMETTLAAMTGPPYQARRVSFHLPDFIDIILNAGGSRYAAGGIGGQSLPNWGPVANEGRGRTVVMTNLDADDDSKARYLEKAGSLFCAASMQYVNSDPRLENLSVILHEAAHNLGPSHEYTVDGKVDGDIFGGPLAAMLEELKAQTSALYFTDWLVQKQIIDDGTALEMHVGDIAWAMGQVAQGMYDADGKSKAYSQVAAVQLGTLIDSGAVAFESGAEAGNGKDRGCFQVNPAKLKPAIESLERRVLHIKGAGDKADAGQLMASYVDDTGHWRDLRGVIAERWLRVPKTSFVYSVR